MDSICYKIHFNALYIHLFFVLNHFSLVFSLNSLENVPVELRERICPSSSPERQRDKNTQQSGEE